MAIFVFSSANKQLNPGGYVLYDESGSIPAIMGYALVSELVRGSRNYVWALIGKKDGSWVANSEKVFVEKTSDITYDSQSSWTENLAEFKGFLADKRNQNRKVIPQFWLHEHLLPAAIALPDD